MLRHRHGFALVAVLLFAASAAAEAHIAAGRAIGRGETHAYAVDAMAGQVVEIDVAATDVELSAVSPKGAVVVSGTTKFSRRLLFPAEGEGEYRVVVHAPARSTIGGCYDAVLRQRVATAEDAKHLAAQQSVLAAVALLGEQKAAAARAAIARFEEALRVWRELGDRRREAETLHALGLGYWEKTFGAPLTVCYDPFYGYWTDNGDLEPYASALSSPAAFSRRSFSITAVTSSSQENFGSFVGS
jgi:hypothetical protein